MMSSTETLAVAGCNHDWVRQCEHPAYSKCRNCETRTLKAWPEPADVYTSDYWTGERSHPTIREQVHNVGVHVENGRTKNQFVHAYLGATGPVTDLMEVGCVPGTLLGEVRQQYGTKEIYAVESEWGFFDEMQNCGLPPDARQIAGLFPYCTSGVWRATLSHFIALDVFEHSPCPVEFLQEAYRLLKPGGHLMMMLPLVKPNENAAPRSYHAEEHIYIHSTTGMRMMLEDIGFESVVFDQWCHVHDWVWAIKGGKS